MEPKDARRIEARDQKRAFRLGKVEDAAPLIERLLDAIVDGDITREQFLWQKFINDDDKRVAFEAFRLALSYKYGRPTEKKDITVKEANYVAELPAKSDAEGWAKRYGMPDEGSA